jgi:hypothetical protein
LEYYEWKKCSYSGSEQNENFSKYLQDKAIFAVNCVILCSKSKFKLLYLKIWAYILSNFFSQMILDMLQSSQSKNLSAPFCSECIFVVSKKAKNAIFHENFRYLIFMWKRIQIQKKYFISITSSTYLWQVNLKKK